MAKLFVALGALLFVIGLLIQFAPGLINWFGKLPGDIRIENEHSFVFIPITSMLLISVVLTVLVNLFFRR